MATPMDFPPSPIVGTRYVNEIGVVYVWDGTVWNVVYEQEPPFGSVGALLQQVRVLLQDTDLSSGQYRYSTNSLIANLNQGMSELFRLRPDLFLEQGFIVPVFNSGDLDPQLGIEMQYVPALVYYVVGLTQARDDEQNQDSRATGFLKVFQSSVVTGALG